jgi:hypothetical protein
MSTAEGSTVTFAADERETLDALLAGRFRPGDANDAVRMLEGTEGLIARLQAIQVHSVATIDRVRDGSRGGLAEVALAVSAT